MTSSSPRLVALVTNTGWNMLRFRSGLIERLVEDGWRVIAIADFSDAQAEQARALGALPLCVPVEGSGTHPLRDLRYFAALLRAYRRHRPDVVHHFSIKPVVYGSLAAKADDTNAELAHDRTRACGLRAATRYIQVHCSLLSTRSRR